MPEYNYELFADYHQIYLQDAQAVGDLSDSWTAEASENYLAVAPGTIGIGTARDMTVPVKVEVRDAAPDDNYDAWDQVNKCSINVPSGRIIIAGCTDYFPDAERIEVAAGCYRARIYYGNLEALSEDGLEGDDHYRVVLWPGEPTEPKILKKKSRAD